MESILTRLVELARSSHSFGCAAIDADRDACDCGADEHNAEVDLIAGQLENAALLDRRILANLVASNDFLDRLNKAGLRTSWADYDRVRKEFVGDMRKEAPEPTTTE